MLVDWSGCHLVSLFAVWCSVVAICWLFVFVGGYCLFAVVLGRVSWCSRFGVCLLFGLLLVLILWLVACYCVDWFLLLIGCFIVIECVVVMLCLGVAL